MKRIAIAALLVAGTVLSACDEKPKDASLPPPHKLTAEAVGNYCGMNLVEHAGPKGHIILAGWPEPVWFSSARDVFAYTMLPEEPKDIRAIYVSDMAKAPSWDEPGPDNWIEARKAFFVIESSRSSGMGAAETVPFGEHEAAKKFAAEHGGRIVGFSEVPRDYILGSGPAEQHSADHSQSRLAHGQ